MLSHGNVLANVAGASAALAPARPRRDEVFLSFLPLSHAYEHTAGQFLPIAVGAQIYYAEGLETRSTNLLEARPTIDRRCRALRGHASAHPQRGRKGARPKWLFVKAVELGARRYEQPAALSLGERLLDRCSTALVREKVRARFGGRIKAMVSAAAPLNYEVGLFFPALGCRCSRATARPRPAPVISVNTRGHQADTVGPADPRDRGQDRRRRRDPGARRMVMQGYWRDEEATARRSATAGCTPAISA